MVFIKNKKHSSNYWIHKIKTELLNDIARDKVIGAKSKMSRLIRGIKAGDRILFFTTLPINKIKSICFVGYTIVEKTYNDNSKPYGRYESPRKLKLKGIKYFTNPVIMRKIAHNLEFVNQKNPSATFKSEYKSINEKDFKYILSRAVLTDKTPPYLEKVSLELDRFIIDSIRALHHLLQKTDRKYIEIKTFLRILKEFLDLYNVKKTYDEIEEFYAYNAWRTGIKHKPIRDPDKIVTLYNSRGKPQNFGLVMIR